MMASIHPASRAVQTAHAPQRPGPRATGEIADNRIELTSALRDRFRRYWHSVMGPDKRPNPATPFEYLKSDGFWHLEHVPPPVDDTPMAAAATLDGELFDLLLHEESRDQ